jgi:hypothetical protein
MPTGRAAETWLPAAIVPRRMATASSPTAATAPASRSTESPLRRYLPAAATILGVAVAMRVIYDPWYLNYDARYALDWARDFWTGHNPDFLADFAPTPHPLSTAISSLGLPFGHSGDQVVVWLVLFGFGALVWLSYRLGERLFNPWVGVVTALVVVTRPAILRDTLLGYQDIWFEALIVGAVLLEAGKRRRGVPVLVLLALAGLLRPEAWLLSGLYWLWLWRDATPRQRVLYALLVASAPVLWSLMDLIVTGDALHSLHGTADLAQANGRRRSIDQVPRWTAQYFAFTLREPLALGVPLGLAFAWRHRLKQSWLPLAVVAAMTAVFAVGPIFGLPLIGRYLRTPSVFLALFYGLAVFGWLMLKPGTRDRKIWMWLGVVAGLASVVWLPWHVKMLDGLRTRSHNEGSLYGDLRTAGEAPVVRQAFDRCGPLSASDHRPIPYVRWWLDGDPGSVGTIESHASPLGKLLLAPRQTKYARRFYTINLKRFAVAAPPGWRTLYQNRSWRIYAAPTCR